METSIAKTNEQFPTTCSQPAPAKWSSVTLPFIRKSTQRTIGIQFAKDADGNFRIMAVWSPSPAATAELKIGDLILAVNHLDAREMGLDDLSRENSRASRNGSKSFHRFWRATAQGAAGNNVPSVRFELKSTTAESYQLKV
jgi:C-terminal processing protease CtpA/Prc